MKCLFCENEAHSKGKYPNLCSKCRAKEVGKLISKRNAEKRLKDPDALKKQSSRSLVYWTSRGYSEEEGKIKIKELYTKHSNKMKSLWNDNVYDDRLIPTQLEYWLEKGYSLEEAKQKHSERQKTFSKEICIQKHGEEKGLEVFNQRQKKWQETLKNLPNYNDIQKSKGISLEKYINMYGVDVGGQKYEDLLKNRSSGYSKISQELFWYILKNYLNETETEKCYFYEHQHEFAKAHKKQAYLYDFVISNLKICIEFHGDIWHANPAIYNEENYKHPFGDLRCDEIHKNDKIKQELIEEFGFGYYVVWESDFKNDPNKVYKTIKGIINEHREKIHGST